MTIAGINEIFAHIQQRYPLKAYLYRVSILGGDQSTDSTPDIMLNCASVTVPGINIPIGQNKPYGIGLNRFFPISKSFTEVNMDFYESDGEPERYYFKNWMDKIFDPVTQRIGFYKDIVKTIIVTQYDKSGNVTYQAKILDAFPINLSPLQKGYENGGISRFNVSFQFFKVEELHFDTKNGIRPQF